MFRSYVFYSALRAERRRLGLTRYHHHPRVLVIFTVLLCPLYNMIH